MGFLSRWLSRFCYDHPNLAIPGLMKYIAIGNVIVYLLDLASNYTFSALLSFVPAYIFQGQVWRLLTFIFVPMHTSPVWFVISVILYYSLGNQLERTWGSTRFTVYYGLGVILTAVMGLALQFTPFNWLAVANMYYVNMSIFFGYATLYPDAEFRIYFLFPIKAKWLAWLDAALFAFDIFSWIGAGQYLLALQPVVALLNYLIFFWDDLKGFAGNARHRVQHQTSRQTINFHAAQRQAQQRRGYLHKCAVCGVTDADDPAMEFRYCSKCSGYHCYCMKHINDHVHVQ